MMDRRIGAGECSVSSRQCSRPTRPQVRTSVTPRPVSAHQSVLGDVRRGHLSKHDKYNVTMLNHGKKFRNQDRECKASSNDVRKTGKPPRTWPVCLFVRTPLVSLFSFLIRKQKMKNGY